MRNVLQADWYWERIEAQFRTTLHTHGCLRMKNDHQLVENTHLALIGFLTQEKLDHMKLNEDIETNVPIIENNTFTEEEIQDATKWKNLWVITIYTIVLAFVIMLVLRLIKTTKIRRK